MHSPMNVKIKWVIREVRYGSVNRTKRIQKCVQVWDFVNTALHSRVP